MGEACVYTYRTFINLVTAFLQNELSVVRTLMGTYTQLFLRVTECHQCQTLLEWEKHGNKDSSLGLSFTRVDLWNVIWYKEATCPSVSALSRSPLLLRVSHSALYFLALPNFQRRKFSLCEAPLLPPTNQITLQKVPWSGFWAYEREGTENVSISALQ